jgi:hypothetical protein
LIRCHRTCAVLADLEFAVGLGGRDDHVLGAAVAAMRIRQIFVIRRSLPNTAADVEDLGFATLDAVAWLVPAYKR